MLEETDWPSCLPVLNYDTEIFWRPDFRAFAFFRTPGISLWTVENHRPACVIMTPNRRQAISNHHADSSMIK